MTWQSPFEAPGSWYKAAFHVHTTQSDGRVAPEEALTWYREQGYDIVALTDHRRLTLGAPATAHSGLLTISGVELDGPGYHMVGLGAKTLPESVDRLPVQVAANAIRDGGGIAIMAHPYWIGQTSAEILSVDGISALEVFNTVCEQERGLGYARQTWDELLEAGKRLWGVAVDDTHWIGDEAGRGFVMVRAPELTEEAVLAAVASGSFYASQGPTIQDLRIVDGEGGPCLSVRCSVCARIVFHAAGPLGRVVHPTAHGILTGGSIALQADQIYVRVECTDAQGRTAWSNPVYLADVLS